MSGAVSVTEWLLDSDPAIRWQVLRDLTDEPANVGAAERARVATEGWGARLLALQTDDGMWCGGMHGPERTGTTPTLHLLRVVGLDPASVPARTAITLYGPDGAAIVSPVWFRVHDGWFEASYSRGSGARSAASSGHTRDRKSAGRRYSMPKYEWRARSPRDAVFGGKSRTFSETTYEACAETAVDQIGSSFGSRSSVHGGYASSPM